MGALGEAFVEIRARMDQLSSDLANAESEVSKRMKGISDRMTGLGTSMSATITAPFAALGAVLFKTQSDAMASVGQIQASLGVTGEEAKKLAGTAQEVWKAGFGANLDEVNQSIILVKQGMAGIAEEDLQSTTQGAMTLAQVMGEDVGGVVKGADGLMQTFGISSQDALDLLTVGTQKGANETNDLLDTVREYGPMFNQLGFSAEDMMATLVAGSDNAAFTTDKLADAYKEFSLRVVDGSKKTSEAMQGLGLDADDMAASIAKGGPEAAKATETILTKLAGIKDPLEQNRLGVELFGTQWEDLGGEVLLASVQAENGLGKITGANKEAQDAINAGNPMKALQIAGRELSAAIGPIMQPFIDLLINRVVPAVQAFSDKFAALPQPMKNAIGIIGAVVAAIGPMLLVIAKAITVFTTLAPLLSKLRTAFMLVRIAIMAMGGPITIAIGIIIGLIAIVTKLWKENETFRTVVTNVWNAIKSFFTKVVTAIKDAFVRDWNTIKTTATAIWNTIKTVTSTVWNAIKSALTAVWNFLKTTITERFNFYKTLITNIWNAIKTVSSAVWEGIKTALSAIWDFLKTRITNSFNFYKTLITNVWNAIKTVSTSVWNAIKTALTTVFNAIKTVITTVWNTIKTVTTTVWNAIKTALTTVFNFLKTAITNAWNFYKSLVTKNWNAIKSVTSSVWNGIKSLLSGVWNAIKSLASSVWNGLKSTLSGAWNSIRSSASSVFNSIRNTVTGVWNSLRNTVGNAANNIKNKVQSAFRSLAGSMRGIWNGVVSGIKGALNVGIRALNRFISGVNNAIRKLNKAPGVNLPTVPSIPLLARGGNIISDGLAIVGERGPELLNLPRGARVSPLGGDGDLESVGGKTMQLVQNIQAKATPQDLQIYTERALRKISRQSGLIF